MTTEKIMFVMHKPRPFVYNDGGRKESGFEGDTGDCCVRALAIVTGKPYKEIYDKVNEFSKCEKTGKKKKGKSNARTGVYKTTTKKVMAFYGLKFVPTMFIGSGCKVHLKKEELPSGNIICNVSKHFVAMKDGVVHDTHDPSRGGTRCVYGYWKREGKL